MADSIILERSGKDSKSETLVIVLVVAIAAAVAYFLFKNQILSGLQGLGGYFGGGGGGYGGSTGQTQQTSQQQLNQGIQQSTLNQQGQQQSGTINFNEFSTPTKTQYTALASSPALANQILQNVNQSFFNQPNSLLTVLARGMPGVTLASNPTQAGYAASVQYGPRSATLIH